MGKQFTLYSAEAYSEPTKKSKVKLFQSLTIFLKSSNLDFWIRLCSVNLEASLTTEVNVLTAKLTLLAYPIFSYQSHAGFCCLINIFFCVPFYSNNLFKL